MTDLRHDDRAAMLRHLWDESAAAYDAHTRRFATHRQITTLLAAAIPGCTPRRVLDFGCGPGNSTRHLRQELPDAELLGLDISEPMITLAGAGTDPSANISYRCADVTTLTNTDAERFDVIVCSNSLFHVDDKLALLAQFRRLLKPTGHLVFSLYDTVWRPDHRQMWPLAGIENDTLMTQLIDELRRHGLPVTRRKQDREILTEQTLADLFAAGGFAVQCAGMLRLRRTPAERLSFFAIPAVTREVFPDLDHTRAASIIHNLPEAHHAPDIHRTVYAFTAALTGEATTVTDTHRW